MLVKQLTPVRELLTSLPLLPLPFTFNNLDVPVDGQILEPF
jgi:hypothetical protein